MRTPAILPTGRNLHGFDPYRIPSAFAIADGARQAERVLARYAADGHPFPEPVAVVLWGTDNLKSEGGPIGQALAPDRRAAALRRLRPPRRREPDPARGARPAADRRVITLSGIFRDLLPLQIKLLAEACWLAASADEPVEMNFVRKHALATRRGVRLRSRDRVAARLQQRRGRLRRECRHADRRRRLDRRGRDLETPISQRKCFAYGRKGTSAPQPALFESVLATVDFAYQNLDSVELGVTSIDHYFDSLGGMGRAAARARGGARRADLHLRPDPRRGQGALARANRSRSRRARGSSTRNGTRACSSTATRASGRSRRT